MPAIFLPSDPTTNPTPQYLAQSEAAAILTFTGIVGCLALIAVCLRLYVRQFMLHFVGPDDIVMAFAMLSGVAVYICFIGESHYGLGRHLAALSVDQIEIFTHWQFVHYIVNVFGDSLCKISICLLLIRLVKHRRFVYTLWGLLIFLVLFTIASVLVIVCACLPTEADWNFVLMANAKCLSGKTFVGLGIVSSGINIGTDILLALMPIPVIVSLSLNKRTKIALCIVMGLGVIAVGAGAVKIHAQYGYLTDTDRLYKDRYAVWAAIELYFGIIAASLPTLKPLVAAFLSSARQTLHTTPRGRRVQKTPTIRNARVHDSHFSTVGSNEVVSECSSDIESFRTASKLGSYFTSTKLSDLTTDCTRSDSVQLGTVVTWSLEPQQRRPTREACIVRTTQVTTTSEPVAYGLEAPRPVSQRAVLRTRSSLEGGAFLSAAQREEADLPMPKFDHLRTL